MENSWHYHPEIELTHFAEGESVRLVGNSIRQANTEYFGETNTKRLWIFFEYDNIPFDNNQAERNLHTKETKLLSDEWNI